MAYSQKSALCKFALAKCFITFRCVDIEGGIVDSETKSVRGEQRLVLSKLGIFFSADDTLKYVFLFFPEKQILGDNLHAMSKPNFWG